MEQKSVDKKGRRKYICLNTVNHIEIVGFKNNLNVTVIVHE